MPILLTNSAWNSRLKLQNMYNKSLTCKYVHLKTMLKICYHCKNTTNPQTNLQIKLYG